MNTYRTLPARRGFTLVELLVAMAITTIIASVLVSVTAVAVDAWNRSRAELRASRQAKFMVDSLVKDFESLVSRRGNNFEWLSALSSKNLPGTGTHQSTNASNLIFFTAATDRYEGKINTRADLGGDVSCVAYELDYQDPINGSNDQYSTFTLYRLLVNPDQAFANLLGKPELETAFKAYRNQVTDVENFVCENVFQFSMTFHIEVVKNAGTAEATKMTVPVTMGPTAGGGRITSFRVLGTGLELDSSPSTNVTVEELRTGRLAAMEVSLTVVSDFGLRQMQNAKIKGKALQKLMARNSFQYSKLVQLPGM